jgi:hypothetical protein
MELYQSFVAVHKFVKLQGGFIQIGSLMPGPWDIALDIKLRIRKFVCRQASGVASRLFISETK